MAGFLVALALLGVVYLITRDLDGVKKFDAKVSGFTRSVKDRF